MRTSSGQRAGEWHRPKEPLLSCTGLSLQTAYMKNMSILYWINDFSARILFTHFCVDSPSIYVGNRKKSLRILYKNKKLFCATF